MQLTYTMGQSPAPVASADLGLSALGLPVYALAGMALVVLLGAGAYTFRRRRKRIRDVQSIKAILKQDNDMDVPTITYLLARDNPGANYAARDVAKLLESLAAKGEVASAVVDSVESYAQVRRQLYSLRT